MAGCGKGRGNYSPNYVSVCDMTFDLLCMKTYVLELTLHCLFRQLFSLDIDYYVSYNRICCIVACFFLASDDPNIMPEKLRGPDASVLATRSRHATVVPRASDVHRKNG